MLFVKANIFLFAGKEENFPSAKRILGLFFIMGFLLLKSLIVLVSLNLVRDCLTVSARSYIKERFFTLSLVICAKLLIK